MRDKKKIVIFFSFAFILVYSFLVFDVNFHGPDEPVYFAYTKSIVEDGDLNLINQVYSDFGQIVTKTYNFPDFHTHGGVILWAPFYLSAKFLHSIADQLGLGYFTEEGFDKLSKCILSFSTIIFGLLSLFLTYFFCRRYFSRAVSILSVLAIFLGTPFFYYMFFETGNSSIAGCLFSILLILSCSFMADFKKQHWLLYGLFFSLSVIVRRELFFQFFFVFIFYVFLIFKKQIDWKSGLYFLVGFIFPFSLEIVNNYLKYGVWFYIGKAAYLFYFPHELLIGFIHKFTGAGNNLAVPFCYNGFFDSFRGIFYASPIFYICVFGFILVALDLFKKNRDRQLENKDILLGILSFYLAFKLMFFINRFNLAGDSPAARYLIVEFPIFVLLFARVMQKKYFLYPVLFVSVFLIFWNLLILSEFMTGLDWVYVADTPSLTDRFSALKYIQYALFSVKDLGIKLKICLPAALIIFSLILYARKKYFSYNLSQIQKIIRGLSLFTIYSFIAYFSLTLLNIVNNARNVEKLKQAGFLKCARIIKVSSGELTLLQQEDSRDTVFERNYYLALKGQTEILRQDAKAGLDGSERIRYNILPIRTAYTNLSDSFMRSGRYQKAIECYQDRIKIAPNDFDSYISLADLYLTIAEYNKAIKYFEQALAINPNFIKLYIEIGQIYEKIGKPDQAIESYQKAIFYNPTLFEAYIGLGDAYKSMGNYDKAAERYLESLRLNPNLVEVYANLAEIYNHQLNFDKAIEYYLKALQFNPNSRDGIYFNLGSIYARLNNYSKAIEYFNKALQLNPNSADAYINLGSIYQAQANSIKALECFNRAVQLNPNCVDAHLNLGHINKDQGDYDQAIIHFQQCLRLRPAFEDVHSVLVEVFRNKGDKENALKQIKKLRDLGKNALAEELEKTIVIGD
jgi:tetratricopeptide (TPR) repeat protein